MDGWSAIPIFVRAWRLCGLRELRAGCGSQVRVGQHVPSGARLVTEREPDPSQDVARDPERLAYRHKQWSESFAYEDLTHSVLEATGCNRKQLYVCKTAHSGYGRNETSYAKCTAVSP